VTELISRQTKLTVSGAHAHDIPPPNRVGPETLKLLAEKVNEGAARPTAMALQLSSKTVAGDSGSSEPRRLGRAIEAAFQHVYGSDLGIAGLQNIRTLIGEEPFVRSVVLFHVVTSCSTRHSSQVTRTIC